jgi:hypothetical protein
MKTTLASIILKAMKHFIFEKIFEIFEDNIKITIYHGCVSMSKTQLFTLPIDLLFVWIWILAIREAGLKSITDDDGKEE